MKGKEEISSQDQLAFVKEESERRKAKLEALKKKRATEQMKLSIFDETVELAEEQRERTTSMVQEGIFFKNQSSSNQTNTISSTQDTRNEDEEMQKRQNSSGVLVSWLAHCHEKGQPPYSPDLISLIEFLTEGHQEFGWSHEKILTVVDIVKSAIKRSHGFEGFVDEDLLDETLRAVKWMEDIANLEKANKNISQSWVN
eukprot:c2485_g1_i1.p1 GENE.c2485_g1_i1~~c2485_g1_i1.p1  ORF type:complete len:199 (+),score=98.82 c2485_g1_i1:8-604(+)